eukprot:1442334-Prymnesium_polylepis.1
MTVYTFSVVRILEYTRGRTCENTLRSILCASKTGRTRAQNSRGSSAASAFHRRRHTAVRVSHPGSAKYWSRM